MAEAEKRWVEAPSISGRWNPQAPKDVGDKLAGVYLEKVDSPYMGRPNLKYFIQTDHPCATDDGVAFVYGTDILNDKMKDIPPGQGYEIEIEFKGERRTGDRTKKPLKLFIVRANITTDDPLYRKWYPEEEESEATPAAELQTQDHTKTDEEIAGYVDILQSEFKKVTCEAIINLAEMDESNKVISTKQLTNLKLRLAELHKQGKIDPMRGIKFK
jgi:hypothetical protein